MDPKKNTTCEYCGGEYKNVKVHQRFCKAKKEALEKGENIPKEVKEEIIKEVVPVEEVKEETISTPEELKEVAEEAKVEQEAVSEAISPTVPEGSIPEDDKVTQEQVDLVTNALKETEDKEKEDLVIDDAMKDAMKDIGVIKIKDESLLKEQELTEEQKIIFKEESVIEFNEPKDVWETKLCDIFKQVDSGREVHIKLKGQLSHEFTTTDGTVRYPSDVFINAIRTFCSNFRDELNNYGGQTFICRRK